MMKWVGCSAQDKVQAVTQQKQLTAGLNTYGE